MSEEITDFIYLRDGEELTTLIWEQYEFILCDKNGEPRIDRQGKPLIVVGPPPKDLVLKVLHCLVMA